MLLDLESHYIKMIGAYSTVEMKPIFNQAIEKGQKGSQEQAQQIYSKAFRSPAGFSVALHERGKMVDSKGFAELLDKQQQISFFIGGAYGLEQGFVDSCTMALSLSALTLSHDLARLVLLEQIYRGFSINSNHPYHK